MLDELRGSIEAICALHNIWQDATLLCYERDGQPCHRHVIRDLIEEPGRLGLRAGP